MEQIYRVLVSLVVGLALVGWAYTVDPAAPLGMILALLAVGYAFGPVITDGVSA